MRLYRVVLCLLSLGVPAAFAEQRPIAPRINAATQILENYRKYPDRYIRIVEESWKLDPNNQVHGRPSAVHSLTLKNIANAPYQEIEVRLSYQTAAGKELLTRTLKVDGDLKPMSTRQVKLRTGAIPDAAEKVVTAIVKAVVKT